MDPELARLIDEDTPKLNPDIANGLAVKHMTEAERYVDQVMRIAVKGGPVGLVYTGFERCTPEEEFNEVSRKKSARRWYDLAPSYVFLVKYLFEYNGEPLPPRYMYLPFVGEAGSIVLSGSRFFISPVLSDRVVSIGVSDIFVRLLVARLIFKRKNHQFLINGARHEVQLACSMIHHKTEEMRAARPSVKGTCTLMHYLLCKYGFAEAFKMFGNCSPIVGKEEIDVDAYPESDWVICSSTQLKPEGGARGLYTPSRIRVAIRKEEFTPIVKLMIGGFFYVTDFFPSRVEPEFVNSERLWTVLMGFMMWSSDMGELWLYDRMEAHIRSLDEYLDSIFLQKFKETGLEIENIYQLFAVIIENFNSWILSEKDKVASMYDKELSVLYYVLYSISSTIVRMSFKLRAMAASKRELTAKELQGVMQMFLKPREIYAIRRERREVASVMYSGDNKAFRITCMLTPQNAAGAHGARTKYANYTDPGVQLHVSVAEIGGIYNPTDSGPDGRFRINPFVKIDETGMVMRNPEMVEMLDSIQEKYFKR